MSKLPEDKTKQAAQESAVRLRRAMEEIQALQITERVLTGIERAMLGRIPEKQYDTTAVTNAARDCSEAAQSDDRALLADTAKERLARELDKWRAALAERDAGIAPLNLRRFCERADFVLDAHTFAALMRFYRSLPHTHLTQSKYDFAVTRLFTTINGDGGRALRISRDHLSKRLAELCTAWGYPPANSSNEDFEIASALTTFNAFIAEVNTLTRFDDFISRDPFNRIRAFKNGLGETFYAPPVTAAAIECNVVISNKFSAMLAAEGEQIREAPAVCQDIAEIFTDTSHAADSQITQLLQELQPSGGDDQPAGGETNLRLARLMRLLDLAEGKDGQVPAAKNGSPGGVVSSLGESRGDAASFDESADALRWLAEVPGNEAIVASFQREGRSPEVRQLDVTHFLALFEVEPGQSPGAPAGAAYFDAPLNHARHAALELILKVDDFLSAEAEKKGTPNAEAEPGLADLLKEISEIEGRLGVERSHAWTRRARAESEALLYVFNQLTAARLRLQANAMRQSASELVRQEAKGAAAAAAAATAAAAVPPAAVPPGQVRANPRKESAAAAGGGKAAAPVSAPSIEERTGHRSPPQFRLLLVAAALLIAVTSLALRAFMSPGVSVAERDREVSVLDRNEMPGGELLVDARLRRDLMIGVAADTWTQLREDQKREKLTSYMNYGKGKGARTVMLLDKRGQPLGTVTGQQMTIEGSSSAP